MKSTHFLVGEILFLGDDFKYFLFSPPFEEDSHFDEHIFQMGGFNHQLDFHLARWAFPKIMVPPNHPISNRVFYYFHHPFWGTPIFWKHPCSTLKREVFFFSWFLVPISYAGALHLEDCQHILVDFHLALINLSVPSFFQHQKNTSPPTMTPEKWPQGTGTTPPEAKPGRWSSSWVFTGMLINNLSR